MALVVNLTPSERAGFHILLGEEFRNGRQPCGAVK